MVDIRFDNRSVSGWIAFGVKREMWQRRRYDESTA